MSAATDQFQRWLDQGYIDAEGFAPASDHQSAVSERYGLSLGTIGSGRGRPGGGGLPFSREAPGGREFTPETWKVDSAEDILRYLEFAQEMAPHATSKQESFNIPQYTGQDVYDFFIKPQEVARMESARAGIASGLDRGRRLAAAEGGKMASSIAGSAPSAYGATSQRALASRGGPFAERALVEGLKGIANTVTSDPTRTAPISRLGQLASTGHGIHRDLNLGIADAFSALGGAGGDTGGLGPAGAVINLGLGAIATPFQMGGIDQARRHQEVLDRKLASLSDYKTMDWGTDLPQAGSTPQQQASAVSLEQSLGEIFPSDGQKKKQQQGGSPFAYNV